MAWNGSDKGKAKVEGQGQEKVERRGLNTPRSTLRHGVLAGLVVVALGCGAIWWFVGRPDADQLPTTNQPTTTHTIAEVKPDIATNRVEEKVAEPEKKPDPNARPTRVGQKLNGYVMLASGRLHPVKGETVFDPSKTMRSKYAIFKHSSENIIAGLLCVKPGDGLVGMPHYRGKFIEDFSKSLFDPIEISPDDSEEDKELKLLVSEVKENLRKEMNDGKDVEQIVMDAREECQRLAQYKQMMKQSIYEELRKDDVTDEDVKTYVEAANKMLAEKGIAPIELGPISRVQIKKK